MLNISNQLYTYIDTHYNENRKALIYKAFQLFEDFDVRFYEDPYLDYLNSVEELGYDKLQDIFNARLIRDLDFICQEHQVHISRDMDVELKDLLDVVNFLFLLGKMEDYRSVKHVIDSTLTTEEKLFVMMDTLRIMDDKRRRELIVSVGDGLIELIRNLIRDSAEEETAQEDEELMDRHTMRINRFFSFLGDTECLGRRLYNKGFRGLTLRELDDLVPYDMIDRIVVPYKPEETALNILSLLIITRCGHRNLIEKLDENVDRLYRDKELLTTTKPIVKHMLTDYLSYEEANAQLERDDVNNHRVS